MKKYQAPEMEIHTVSMADIITTSPGTEGPIIEIKEDSIWNFDMDTGTHEASN